MMTAMFAAQNRSTLCSLKYSDFFWVNSDAENVRDVDPEGADKQLFDFYGAICADKQYENDPIIRTGHRADKQYWQLYAGEEGDWGGHRYFYPTPGLESGLFPDIDMSGLPVPPSGYNNAEMFWTVGLPHDNPYGDNKVIYSWRQNINYIYHYQWLWRPDNKFEHVHLEFRVGQFGSEWVQIASGGSVTIPSLGPGTTTKAVFSFTQREVYYNGTLLMTSTLPVTLDNMMSVDTHALFTTSYITSEPFKYETMSGAEWVDARIIPGELTTAERSEILSRIRGKYGI